MRRLYLRIYLAVLASLAAFALASGILWRQLGDVGPAGHAFEVAGTLAQNVLPPAAAPQREQQAALEKLAANLRADVTLFAADRTRLASVGDPLLAPDAGRDRGGWLRRWGPPTGAIRLPDGRWLAARVPHDRRRPGVPLFFTLALLALAVGVGAYPVVRRLTRRLERLQAGVESLGAGEFSARVKVEGRDEVAQLAASFNRAAGRIEELVAAHRSLLANASHELRTPLARIRMAVELMKESADPKRKRDLEQDVAELDALIDEILLASRLDVVQEQGGDEDVDLLALASEESARYEAVEVVGEPVVVRGEPRLLRRLIRNLLENARRHGAPPVEVRVTRADGRAELRVTDHGPGIADAERDDVFRPFRRFAGPGERTGAGLGLALVRQIARRHGGEARYLGRDRSGSCFSVTLEPSSRGRCTSDADIAANSIIMEGAMPESAALAGLRGRFEVPGVVTFHEGPNGLVRVAVVGPGGEAHVYLHGGHVTHYAPVGHQPVLFTSARSFFARDKAIRGGVPIIFPWFGARAGHPQAPQHGFARVAEWEVVAVEPSHGSVPSVVLGLRPSEASRAAWPFDFDVRYRITVGATLDLALDVRNTSAQPFTFEEALHTYLAVADVTDVGVTGLAGAAYIDKVDGMARKRQGSEPVRITGETDRVYLGTREACVVDDPRGGRRLVVDKHGSASTVVWNPWRDKARAMADFGPEEWRSMLCIETANAADDAVTLAPGQRHEMRASIGVA